MKLLIVDDNKYVVEGLKRRLNWELFGIDEVFGCFGVSQAQEILQATEIDFLITDIEMPGGSGFELLEWLRQREMDVESVLLTSYAEFSYAQAAVDYQCFRYLLKPVETAMLEDVVGKLVEKRLQKKQEKQLAQYGNNWLSHQDIAKAIFWRDIMDAETPYGGTVQEIDKGEGGLYPQGALFCVALLCFELDSEEKGWSRELLMFVCENILNEIIKDREAALETLCYNGFSQYALVLGTENGKQQAVKELMDQFLQVFVPFYHRPVGCYLSVPCRLEEVNGHLRRLEEFHLNHLNFHSGIFMEQEYKESRKEEYQAPELEEWKELLRNGQEEALKQKVSLYLHKFKEADIDSSLLQSVLADWNLVVYDLLKERNITIYQFLKNGRNQELVKKAVRSVFFMEELIMGEAGYIAELLAYVQKQDMIISGIQNYIKAHLDTVTRSQIAQTFYLSPNYVSKLFRKETGVSLSEYIQGEKIKLAKRLLTQEDLQISEIAFRTGYPSFAHFSRQFKKYTGVSPTEYRNQNRQ